MSFFPFFCCAYFLWGGSDIVGAAVHGTKCLVLKGCHKAPQEPHFSFEIPLSVLMQPVHKVQCPPRPETELYTCHARGQKVKQ